MSRKSNPTNSSQLTLFETFKRMRQSSEDDNDSINEHQQIQGCDPLPILSLDTTTPVSSDASAETTLHNRTQKQLSISVVIPNANLQSPSDIAKGPNDKPVQPNRYSCSFPSTLVGTKKRSFNPEWLVNYSWLEYSVERDAGFCFPCRIFKSVSGRTEESFTIVGFKDWKHATGKEGILACHAKCYTHINAMTSWHEYKQNEEFGTSVENLMTSARSEQIRLNRHYIKSVSEVLLLCSRLEISFRGHDESENSLNKGNFVEIMQVIGKHDLIIQHRLEQGPQNATYRSPEVQNVLLNIMGNMLRKQICDNVRKANFFSLLADESKDISKMEQLAIIVRYVDEEAIIHERFLTFVEATSLNAESLTSYLISTLNKHGLNPACIVSQAYDGAAVMSGNCHGVQQRIKEVYPSAMYIHCYAHKLNLVLVDSAKKVQLACDFFLLLEAIYVFISTSKAHTIFVGKQKELHPEKQVRQLPKLSDTRWTCRQAAVSAICYTYNSLIATLEEVSGELNRAKAVEATGLLQQIKSFKFLLLLILFDRVLTCTKSLSDCLQNPQVNLDSAADLVSSTVSTLEYFRTDNEWDNIFNYTEKIARSNHIDITNYQPPRQRHLPQHLKDFTIFEPTGRREPLSTNQQYKLNLYFPILDAFLTELNRRFSKGNIDIMRAIHSFNPQSVYFLDPVHMKPLALIYNLEYELLSMESILAKRTLENAEINSTNDLLLKLKPLRDAFPTLLKAIHISLTISISTAECERSFSTLKRIKTYLRSTMTQQRLTDLAILTIEKELTNQLSLDDIVTEFGKLDKNRRILLA